jgi:hypothetical protein
VNTPIRSLLNYSTLLGTLIILATSLNTYAGPSEPELGLCRQSLGGTGTPRISERERETPPIESRVPDVRKPLADVLAGMLNFLAQVGDTRFLEVERVRGQGSDTTTTIKLPDNAEAGFGVLENGGNLFFMKVFFGWDLGDVSTLKYKGKTYKVVSKFGDWDLENLVFTPSGNAADRPVIWLRREGYADIGEESHSIIRIVSLE